MEKKFNLINIQKKILEEILQLPTQVWKIVLYDDKTQIILASLFKISSFRQNNITLHLNINKKRQKLHGVAAIYIIDCLQKNIEILEKDFLNNLYNSCYIFFVYVPSQFYLSKLAKSLSKGNLTNLKKVTYSYCNYNVLQQYMFLAQKPSQLFSLVQNLKYPPIFLFQKSINSQYVVEIKQEFSMKKINKQVQDCTIVMVIPREIDWIPVILHPWEYGPLIDDCFKITNGRVNIQENYLLQLQDPFWNEHFYTPLPYLSEIIQKELGKSKAQQLSISQQSKNAMNSNLIDAIPELNQKKKRLNIHLNLTAKLLQQIKLRKLDEFYQIESNLALKKNLNKDQKNKLQQLMTQKNQQDKIRLYLNNLINNTNRSYLHDLQKQVVLKSQKSKEYFLINRINQFYKNYNAEQQKKQSKQISRIFKYLAKQIEKKGKSLLWSSMSQNKFKLANQVKNVLLIQTNKLSNYTIWDPHNVESMQGIKAVIIYMVEGANYSEYCSLQELRNKCTIPIYYGGNKIIRASDII